ncbi:helix-turn-helix domain-containing protein [Paraburkholderia mimosarum]|uniref:helix-turn-helix domain-containing protein n=1 Tax=Paraburkholderia mimosarum TaxID=312026 RepID=UPI000480F02B|nr:helix-turn-helix domain-containing protein [Paraburkholderia mimosarum]
MPEIDLEPTYLAIAERVRALMERHGVAPRRQASELSRILSLSFSAASRKLKGQYPWDLKQLAAIATHFGEAPSVLIGNIEPFSGAISGKGMLMVAPRPLPCSVTVGDERTTEESPPAESANLVAIPSGDVWCIYPAEIAPPGPVFNVLQVEIRPGSRYPDGPLIAVLDDDLKSNVAQTICDSLNEHGFNAIPFSDLASFRNGIRSNAFKAFVIDWLISGDTSESTIDDLRKSTPPKTPIFLLSGALESGGASEGDIARVLDKFGCEWIEKPVRTQILVHKIRKRLEPSTDV